MGRLNGKAMLITGAASGLGAEQVIACVREGAQVVFGDISDPAGSELEARIRASGGQAAYIHLDVTVEEDWRRAIEKTVTRFGSVNVLVNNAGIAIPKVSIEERTVAEWERVMAVNLRSVFLGTKAVIPEFR